MGGTEPEPDEKEAAQTGAAGALRWRAPSARARWPGADQWSRI